MDFSQSMKMVSSRIQEIEPELASKIVGYLLLQEFSDQDLIRLAFSPDNVIKSMANQVKTLLGLSSSPLVLQLNPYRAPPPSLLRASSLNSSWTSQPHGLYGFANHFQHFEHVEDEFSTKRRVSRRPHSMSEFPPKVCHYFNKGYCKHGDNCRFFHGDPMISESFSQFLGLSLTENVSRNDDYDGFSLDKLEMEIVELLRSRKGNPVSIASLPMLYYERYGRILRAEGYLTESQRHGKVGYSLTKLLARLKNTIRLIDRPHGQHSVILVEDASKYFKGQTEQSGIVPGSRQIYLTFPAESTFTDKDISEYFNTFGPVQDVRIPFQQERMFGFVTFVYSETVRKVFAKGNPHFVCGSRVLVKPYREKSKLTDRKHAEKSRNLMNYQSVQFFDGEPDYESFPGTYDSPMLMRKQFTEKYKEALELVNTSYSESQLLRKPSVRLQYFASSIDQYLNLLEENAEFPTSNFGLDHVRNNESSSYERPGNASSPPRNDPESDKKLKLPENPFFPAMADNMC